MFNALKLNLFHNLKVGHRWHTCITPAEPWLPFTRHDLTDRVCSSVLQNSSNPVPDSSERSVKTYYLWLTLAAGVSPEGDAPANNKSRTMTCKKKELWCKSALDNWKMFSVNTCTIKYLKGANHWGDLCSFKTVKDKIILMCALCSLCSFYFPFGCPSGLANISHKLI